jgi:hypothetical protein
MLLITESFASFSLEIANFDPTEAEKGGLKLRLSKFLP